MAVRAHPSNPNDVRSFEPADAPACDDKRTSRFALGTTPAGYTAQSRGHAVALAYAHLLEARREQAEPVPPPRKTVLLKYVCRTNTGTYELVDRGAVTGTPTFAGSTPGRFAGLRLTAGALLDELMLGPAAGSAWQKARNCDVYEALRDFAESEQLVGEPLRAINDLVSRALLLRAGLDVRPDELPHWTSGNEA